MGYPIFKHGQTNPAYNSGIPIYSTNVFNGYGWTSVGSSYPYNYVWYKGPIKNKWISNVLMIVCEEDGNFEIKSLSIYRYFYGWGWSPFNAIIEIKINGVVEATMDVTSPNSHFVDSGTSRPAVSCSIPILKDDTIEVIVDSVGGYAVVRNDGINYDDPSIEIFDGYP